MSPTAREIFSDALGKDVKETVVNRWTVKSLHLLEGDPENLTIFLVRETNDGEQSVGMLRRIDGNDVFPDGVFEVIDEE